MYFRMYLGVRVLTKIGSRWFGCRRTLILISPTVYGCLIGEITGKFLGNVGELIRCTWGRKLRGI